MDIEAIFEFIAENPPMALICGGILCLILGAIIYPFYTATANILLSWVPWLLGGGFILQILWLFRGAITELIEALF